MFLSSLIIRTFIWVLFLDVLFFIYTRIPLYENLQSKPFTIARKVVKPTEY